jgi:hypothetical protein
MFYAVDGTGDNLPPHRNYNPLAAIYYVAFQLIVNMILIELFTSAVYETYCHLRNVQASSYGYTISHIYKRDACIV